MFFPNKKNWKSKFIKFLFFFLSISSNLKQIWIQFILNLLNVYNNIKNLNKNIENVY
jgi:hypothetical protein